MTILFSGSFTEPSIKSQRISVAGELLNTEVNYVRILKTLCHKYKSGLEDETQCNFDKYNGAINCLYIYFSEWSNFKSHRIKTYIW